MKRSRAELFNYLGAPLKNVQWSWGAVRDLDGAVFLVVWQHESLRRDSRRYHLVHNETYWRDNPDRPLGYTERMKHLELLRQRQGANSFMVMALRANPNADGDVARIQQVNSEEVFVGGELFEDEQGNIWLERVDRIPIENARE